MVQTCLDMSLTVPGIHEERKQNKASGVGKGKVPSIFFWHLIVSVNLSQRHCNTKNIAANKSLI